MTLDNLPGTFNYKQDGGLTPISTSLAPRLLVLGVAARGQTVPFVVGRTKEAAVEFGSSGTLTRGMYEVRTVGADNVLLKRIGATFARIEGIGLTAATGGVIIETSTRDDSAGTDYEFFWDDTQQRLVVKNVDTSTTVYDRDFDDPSATIDTGEVFVSGLPSTGGTDIGDQYSLVTFAAAGSGGYDVTYTAGTDGSNPSRMELYEYLFFAYKELENDDFDFVHPMNVYLDDLNVADGDTPGTYAGSYPTAGVAADILLYFYAEEYEGEYYYYWRQTKTSGAADIYPASYQATSPNGVTITDTVFYEVNFAYQLASFCRDISVNTNECLGMIGVKPPADLSLKGISNWIGKAPTFTINSGNQEVIVGSANNGSGLLGNKFMCGKVGFRANVAYGGFIATDDGTLGGTEIEDLGGEDIDIGKYLSVCGQWATIFNAFDSTGLGYITNIASVYAGYVTTLDSKSAPTNKVVDIARLPFRINNTKLDSLVGFGYVFMKNATKGTVIADAPTATRPSSDYRRLTTVRITKDVLDAVRLACDPFIGEATTAAGQAGLQTAVEGVLAKLQKGGYISRYELSIVASPAERAAGLATIELTVVPAFELRRITVIYAMKAV
jgi:hypothetical protein